MKKAGTLCDDGSPLCKVRVEVKPAGVEKIAEYLQESGSGIRASKIPAGQQVVTIRLSSRARCCASCLASRPPALYSSNNSRTSTKSRSTRRI